MHSAQLSRPGMSMFSARMTFTFPFHVIVNAVRCEVIVKVKTKIRVFFSEVYHEVQYTKTVCEYKTHLTRSCSYFREELATFTQVNIPVENLKFLHITLFSFCDKACIRCYSFKLNHICSMYTFSLAIFFSFMRAHCF